MTANLQVNWTLFIDIIPLVSGRSDIFKSIKNDTLKKKKED